MLKRVISALLIVLIAVAAQGAEKKKGKKAPKGPKPPSYGYTDTPKLPSGWRVHDLNRPHPKVITPGDKPGAAPSDAKVLFDGTDLSNFVGTKQDNPKKPRYNAEGKASWKVGNGFMEANKTGDLYSKDKFGSCQLHFEFATPNPPEGLSQGRGNSGVFFMGLYETQVLDCYDNYSYADGMIGAVYGQTPALVTACKKPGEWQTYDVVFIAPKFEGDKMVSPPYFTSFVNGVLVQHKTALLGPTAHKKLSVVKAHDDKLPLKIQDHNNPTRFRNIWIRELD